MSNGKLIGAVLGVAALAVVAYGAFYFVDVEQTQEARMPTVDVEVEGGQAPEFDVETGSVDIGTNTQTVEVPDIEVTTSETEVTLPTLEVEPAQN
ncbi:MAG: hypothetical protein JJ908_02025 [Rhizobiales bacterium]|nr:hypothetical protein [Hyphomicrobiales bacterium]MBO6698620.1 hypothetical protein [Hyphomicrobiales bacterium]MBO6735127.1 hypothetical protein [Hyphomicrobiales bacterium]MBO6911066.1 hypothetical protein [Hyphomicrobiales bacterium]MBO6957358.1 hypothetical protein [Hyphomicrobiales bacterium]